MKNAEELIKGRYSSQTRNSFIEMNQIFKSIQLAYFEGSRSSVPSAGGIYGLKIIVFYLNQKRVFDSHGMLEEIAFDRTSINRYCFKDSQNNFHEQSILIAVTYDYESYYQKYGNCGVRYAAIEAGAFVQNLQLYLLTEGIHGCPLGFVKNDDLLGLEDEALVYFLLN